MIKTSVKFLSSLHLSLHEITLNGDRSSLENKINNNNIKSRLVGSTIVMICGELGLAFFIYSRLWSESFDYCLALMLFTGQYDFYLIDNIRSLILNCNDYSKYSPFETQDSHYDLVSRWRLKTCLC